MSQRRRSDHSEPRRFSFEAALRGFVGGQPRNDTQNTQIDNTVRASNISSGRRHATDTGHSSRTDQTSIRPGGENVQRAPDEPRQQVTPTAIPTLKEKSIVTANQILKNSYRDYETLSEGVRNGLKYLKDLQRTIDSLEIAMIERQSNIEFYEMQIKRLDKEKEEVKRQSESSLPQTSVLPSSQMEMLKEEYEQNHKRIDEQTQRWIERLKTAKEDLQLLERSMSKANDSLWASWRLLLSYNTSLANATNAIEELKTGPSSYDRADVIRDMERIESNLSEADNKVRDISAQKRSRTRKPNTEVPHSSEA